MSLLINITDDVALSINECSSRIDTLMKGFASRGVYLDWCKYLDEFSGELIAIYQELMKNDVPSDVSITSCYHFYIH